MHTSTLKLNKYQRTHTHNTLKLKQPTHVREKHFTLPLLLIHMYSLCRDADDDFSMQTCGEIIFFFFFSFLALISASASNFFFCFMCNERNVDKTKGKHLEQKCLNYIFFLFVFCFFIFVRVCQLFERLKQRVRDLMAFVGRYKPLYWHLCIYVRMYKQLWEYI